MKKITFDDIVAMITMGLFVINGLNQVNLGSVKAGIMLTLFGVGALVYIFMIGGKK